MKRTLVIIVAVSFLSAGDFSTTSSSADNLFITQQTSLDANNIKSYIWNTGVFDQNLAIQNIPGFEWPKGSGHDAIFTAGLTLGAYVNFQLRLASASYRGEYCPGFCLNGIFYTDSRFKFYKVTRGDNQNTNPDWLNWGLMVPFGAPFIDHNHDGIYEPLIDTPGVKQAAQTIFICLTDADSNTHGSSEGFGGGTKPLYAEVHLTAWCYANSGFQDMQFLKWVIINRGINRWDSTVYTIVSDPDLGFSDDDYIGCDTTRNLGYCYNATNNDVGNSFAYGLNPPACGIMFLNCSSANIKLESFDYFKGPSTPGAPCESEPSTPFEAYLFLNGIKKDGTQWINPFFMPPKITKYCYSGDPEGNSGWTEYTGKINNCGGAITGTIVQSPSGDRRMILGSGNANTLNPNDTQVVQICQLIARGSNNLNSVTRLKQLADVAQNLCANGFVIGVTPISTNVPQQFNLYQNYPNPFNPETKIKFDIATPPHPLPEGEGHVILKIYDVLGREVAMLVNEQLKPGTYEVTWDASNHPSGVYFYKLKTGDFSESKKMILIK